MAKRCAVDYSANEAVPPKKLCEESDCAPIEPQQESTDDEKSEVDEEMYSEYDEEEWIERTLDDEYYEREEGEWIERARAPLSEEQEIRIRDARSYVDNLEIARKKRDYEVPAEQEIEDLTTIAIHRWYIENLHWTQWKHGPYYEFFKQCDL
ncbi:hypothetical protein L596_013326 [Steinernema carpocapsae]|uniref:Uncharacterized protein n=1 Tax=Steinernema carpocapsae TaxID=34508 RepID=A0A4U5NZU9_STECR|nr:hypothetical protein L596_013326 [Steinernema carpocapsae]